MSTAWCAECGAEATNGAEPATSGDRDRGRRCATVPDVTTRAAGADGADGPSDADGPTSTDGPTGPGAPSSRRALVAWAAWDCGSAAFNTIVLTFVFTVYLTGSVAADDASGSSALAAAISISGVLVALIAPVWGQRSDAAGAESGRQRRLGALTAVMVVATALMVMVEPDPDYLLLGLLLIGIASFVYELAQVEYNALIYRLAPAGRTGWISGLGWAAGYLGGIALLAGAAGVFVLTGTGGESTAVRILVVAAAVWLAVLAVPVVLVRFPYAPPTGDAEAARVGVLGSYALLVRRLVALGRSDRHLLGFLVSSAIFRDGLTAIFTFGGIIGSEVFGFDQSGILVFAVAANVVSLAGALAGGKLDDRFGPKIVIVVSLAALVVVAVGLLWVSGTSWSGVGAYWVGGLVLSLFVGPAQACARSYLARLVPVGREGEVFGLYATTGRAVSFLAPALFALFVSVGGETRWGIAGIGIVLLVGLLSLLPVRAVDGRLAAGGAALAVDVPATAGVSAQDGGERADDPRRD